MSEIQLVTRFEVIDHAPGAVSYHPDVARSLVAANVKVELSVQDEGRTLKVFLTRLDVDKQRAEAKVCVCSCPRCGLADAHDCGKPACVNPAGLSPSERDRLEVIRKQRA